MNDWYEENIEEKIRPFVRLLRDNGFNTESSCHHEDPMFIQCQYMPDGKLHDLHKLLWCYLYENDLPVSFSIQINHEVTDGNIYSFLEVKFPKNNNSD